VRHARGRLLRAGEYSAYAGVYACGRVCTRGCMHAGVNESQVVVRLRCGQRRPLDCPGWLVGLGQRARARSARPRRTLFVEAVRTFASAAIPQSQY
jgi:hypothetical protein